MKGVTGMPTRRRKESRTGIYHIIVRGLNHEKIFQQQREKLYFKSIISNYLQKYKVEVYSYCIMSNHAHFIIRAELQILSLFMAAILAEYASYASPAKNPVNIPSLLPLIYPKITGKSIMKLGITPPRLITLPSEF